MWLICLFVQQQDGRAAFLEPWLLLPLACKTRVCLDSWAGYSIFSVAPLLSYSATMPLASRMMRRAVSLYRGRQQLSIVVSGYAPRPHDLLATFFLVTGMPCMLLGIGCFWIINGRALHYIPEETCCLGLLTLGALLTYITCAAYYAIRLTFERCIEVFEGPP